LGIVLSVASKVFYVYIMVPALLVMCGLGAVLGIVLSVASKVFYVYEDPRIGQVEDCLAGANCGGCGYAGCPPQRLPW